VAGTPHSQRANRQRSPDGAMRSPTWAWRRTRSACVASASAPAATGVSWGTSPPRRT